MAYYPALVESSIEYIRYSRKIVAEFEGSPFNEVDFSDDIYKVPLASSFTIEARDGKFYCLNKGQSVEERQAEQKKLLIKPQGLTG